MVGVRPNSPIHTISVLSSRPRSFRSPMSVAQPASRTWLKSRTVSKLFAVRVPVDAVVSAQRHLDEGYAAFDQAPGQQTALAKPVAAVGVAQFGRFLVEIERLPRGRAHEPGGPLVGGLMARCRRAGMVGNEFLLHLLHQAQPGLEVLAADPGMRRQVRNPQALLARIAIADDQRSITRAEETGGLRRGFTEALGAILTNAGRSASSAPASLATRAPIVGYWIGPRFR